MHLTPREFDKLLIYMLAEVARKRRELGLMLNHPEAVAVISAAALAWAMLSLRYCGMSCSERSSCTRTSASLCWRSLVAVSNVTGPDRASSRR